MSPSHSSASYQQNGRGHDNGREPRVTWEILRWLIGMITAAAVAYFTTTKAIEVQLATVKATQDSNYNSLILRLDVMQGDIREIRSAAREQAREPTQQPSRIYVPKDSMFGER